MNIENLLVQDADNFDPSSAHKHHALSMVEKEMRDRFALAALQGLLDNSSYDTPPAETAKLCFRMADAMLEARNG